MIRFQTFGSILEYYAGISPEASALAYGQVQLSYGALLDQVLSRAEALRASEAVCLGILCDGSLSCLVEILAAAEAGLQVVLLNENSEPELLEAADVDSLWGDPELVEELSPALARDASVRNGKLLFFTSGTTSRRKAIVLSPASLCSSAWNGGSLLPLKPSDRLMCMLPLDHVFGFVCGVLWGLSCGACVCLGRGARHYADDLDFYRPTALSAVPMLLGFLLQRKLLNPELKLVLVGAGDCPPSLPAALKSMGIRVSFGYGLTETSSGVALSLGEDPYAMTLCPDNRITLAEDGEILIENPTCMMEGYYRDPSATEAVLRNGVLHTGDLGRFDEKGLLHVVGRKKEILVFPDGTKLFLPEYEGFLASALPNREFAVVSLEGAPALLVRGDPREEPALWEALAPIMRQFPLSRRLKTVKFLNEPLPRTGTGKIQRWILQQKVAAQ